MTAVTREGTHRSCSTRHIEADTLPPCRDDAAGPRAAVPTSGSKMRRSRFYLLALTAIVAACSDTSSRPAAITGPESGPSMSTTTDGTESAGATVETDLSDYAPGAIVTITGAGFQPGETVRLVLSEYVEEHAPRSWDIVADNQGGFTDKSFSPEQHHIGVLFRLSAVGMTSGNIATTQFSDEVHFLMLQLGRSRPVVWRLPRGLNLSEVHGRRP